MRESGMEVVSLSGRSSTVTGADEGVLGRLGSLEVRLARDSSEVALAQEVRFRVFCKDARTGERDSDRYDEFCDHLVVVDSKAADEVIGTYRLLRQEAALAAGGFYSSNEFEIDGLVARHPGLRFLELGRSCVLAQYRSRRTIELLWQGIWAYARRHHIDVMTGCASFAGAVPAAHAQALSLLAHGFRAEADWDARAVAGRYHPMDLVPVEAVDPRAAFAALPPLIKGYLRVGARIGDGCVIDSDFGTTDVLVVLPVSDIERRYINHYGAEAERFAA